MNRILRSFAVLIGLACGVVAHAQSVPPATGQWCSSTGTPAGPWSPCPTGGSTPGTPSYVINPPIAYANPANVTLTPNTAAQIVAAGAYTKTVTICTAPSDTYNVWLSLNGNTVAVGSGIYVPSSGGCVSLIAPTGAIYGLIDSSDSATNVTVSYQGG